MSHDIKTFSHTTYRNDDILDILTSCMFSLVTSVLELISNQLFHSQVSLVIQVKEGCAAFRIGDHIVDKTMTILNTMLIIIRFANKVLQVGKSRLWKTTSLKSMCQ